MANRRYGRQPAYVDDPSRRNVMTRVKRLHLRIILQWRETSLVDRQLTHSTREWELQSFCLKMLVKAFFLLLS